ncbi:unnamed protein product, partial [Rotaria magnacalcarata]
MGSYILNRLDNRRYAKTDTYIAHMTCSDSPPSWLMATSKRILFVTEISIFGTYNIDWKIAYLDLQGMPVIMPEKQVIQILVKKSQGNSTFDTNRPSSKVIKYSNMNNACYFVDKVTNAMHS